MKLTRIVSGSSYIMQIIEVAGNSQFYFYDALKFMKICFINNCNYLISNCIIEPCTHMHIYLVYCGSPL